MKLVIIAAISVDGVIGIGDKMPWRIPEDFKHYRETTMGKTLVVGSTTFKTLPPKAHEGRRFVILSSKTKDVADIKYIYFEDIEEMLDAIKYSEETIYVIGGASVYEQLIDHCDEAVITWVNKFYPEGDKRFPIDNLFANFTTLNDSDWLTSKTGTEYKISKYLRNGNKGKAKEESIS